MMNTEPDEDSAPGAALPLSLQLQQEDLSYANSADEASEEANCSIAQPSNAANSNSLGESSHSVRGNVSVLTLSL